MPELDAQRIKDEEHLRILGILNYVFAGLSALTALSVLPHLIMLNSGLFDRAFDEARKRGAEHGGEFPPPPEFFAHFESIMTIFVVVWATLAFTVAVLSFLNGRYLRSHRHRTFTMIAAGVQCIVIPLGTILGIFTFVVLGRRTIREAYEEE